MNQTPIFTEIEERTQATFTALMMALSYPGEAAPLTTADIGAIGETLLDLETTFFTPDRDLAQRLGKTTARELPVERADYIFLPTLSDSSVPICKQARVGCMLYPDRSATLVIGCRFGDGLTLKLTGPGIQTKKSIQVDGIPSEFFEIRDASISYPLGWDLFLVDGAEVIGLPRTTQVEVL